MKIGLDAKRAFCNRTGLGNYSRDLIIGLNQLSNPSLEIQLYTSKKGDQFDTDKNQIITSNHWLKSYWRSYAIDKDLAANEIALYHGLSNELPFSLEKSPIKKVVTIHDLLQMRFPQHYPLVDRYIYNYKVKSACKIADKIIAVSQATKADIVNFLQVEESKIEVIYPSCSSLFFENKTERQLAIVKKKYQLPEEYVLCVGTIQERKNQMQILKAMSLLPKKMQIPIVLVGNGKAYLKKIQIEAEKLGIQLKIISNVTHSDLPAIYQLASLFIYPALYEGFGIPVVEAMASRVPVITSRDTSMAEIIQDKNALISPSDTGEMATKIRDFLANENHEMIEKNYTRATSFTQEILAQKTADLYLSL